MRTPRRIVVEASSDDLFIDESHGFVCPRYARNRGSEVHRRRQGSLSIHLKVGDDRIQSSFPSESERMGF
jgi:hypothetical protein